MKCIESNSGSLSEPPDFIVEVLYRIRIIYPTIGDGCNVSNEQWLGRAAASELDIHRSVAREVLMMADRPKASQSVQHRCFPLFSKLSGAESVQCVALGQRIAR